MVAVAGYRGTSAQEKSEMPAAAAPYVTFIPRKVLDGAGIWPQNLWLYQKDDGTFRLFNSETVGWAWHFDPENRNKNVPAFNLLLSPMNLGRRTFRKSSSKSFNMESYGLLVKVTPMLPYNFGPPRTIYSVLRENSLAKRREKKCCNRPMSKSCYGRSKLFGKAWRCTVCRKWSNCWQEFFFKQQAASFHHL